MPAWPSSWPRRPIPFSCNRPLWEGAGTPLRGARGQQLGLFLCGAGDAGQSQPGEQAEAARGAAGAELEGPTVPC